MRGRLGLPRIVAVTLTLLVLFVGVDAFVAPPAHPVHTGGGTPASAAAYGSTDDLWWTASDPTESLSQVRCFEWHTDGRPPCSAGLIAARFPGLKQTEHTLYVVWTGCVDWSGAGAIIPWAGYNIEFVDSGHTLLFHCYIGTPWVYVPERLYGVAAQAGGGAILLAITIAGIDAGPLRIREDDRLEHLVGDQSTVYDLSTANIT